MTPSTRSHQWEPEELLRLAEKCEKASAGTWSLSEEVCRALAGPNGNYAMRDVTQSLDAAMTLIPKRWTAWELRSHAAKTRASADLSRLSECDSTQEDWAHGRGKSAALALTAAALRARASTPPEGHNGE